MTQVGKFLVGIDIGGTFTDFVLYETETGNFHVHKVLTTPDEPARCVIDGLQDIVAQSRVRASELSLIIHGTTLITNALIERKGARTALITTEGHRDVLEMGTELRYDAYDLFLEKPDPLVPRPLRLGIKERMGNDGEVVRPLDLADLDRAASALAEQGVESIAICFLHAFRNPSHEQQAATFLSEGYPDVTVSISSLVAPEIREYPRMSTTVANAYVKPLAERYLSHLVDELEEIGYRHPLYLMLSSGGITTADVSAEYPIRLLESGPAGGALFTSFLGQAVDRSQLISFDMGGTTAKMAYIADGQPTRARAFEVARVQRFKMGSGLPVQVPVIEMIEIGAGGGSIAYKDKLGLLKVGPESAGADPGPACYGLGGDRPTVTDANLLLGYLSAENFLGGELPLYSERAEQAIRREVAEPLGLELIDAARGIFDVVNQNMVAATKVHVAEKGRDPRQASLVAFGGAGPIHAHALARALNLQEVICPPRAGVASALGFLVAPIAFEFARSLAELLDGLKAPLLRETFTSMEQRGYETLRKAGIAKSEVTFARRADMRHVGQGHEIEVHLPPGPIDAEYVSRIPELFYAAYRDLYGQAHTDVPIEIITCRVTASGPEHDLQLAYYQEDRASMEAAYKGSRPAYFQEAGGFVEAAVYDRYVLKAGAVIEGAALVEERESTAVIPPWMTGTIDHYGNLSLRFN